MVMLVLFITTDGDVYIRVCVYGLLWCLTRACVCVWWVCVCRYRVVVSYPPQSEAELELKEGDVVFVHRKREDGWFKGTLQRNGRTGLFPGSFVDSI